MECDAEAAYNYLYHAYNKLATSSPENGQKFGFNLDAFMQGMPYDLGEGGAYSPLYDFQYDHATDKEYQLDAVNTFQQLINVIDGDPGNYVIYAGDDMTVEHALEGYDDPAMKRVIYQILQDVNDPYAADKQYKTHAGFTISYAKNMGGVGMDSKTAGIQIVLDSDYAQKFLGTGSEKAGTYKGIVPQNSDFNETFAITVLFDKELDNNIYKTGNRGVMSIVNYMKHNDGKKIEKIPNGGTITMYTRDGQYYYTQELLQFDPKSGDYKSTFSTPIQVPRESIQNIIVTQKQKLEQIAKSNLNAKTQWNKANNFIGGINVNPPNIDYQSEMPGGPISQDQVNTEDIDLSKFE